MFTKSLNDYSTTIYTEEAVIRDNYYVNNQSRNIKIGSIDIEDNQFNGFNSTINWHINAYYDQDHGYIIEDGTYEYDPKSDDYISTPDIYATEPKERIFITKIISERNRLTEPDFEIWEHDPVTAFHCNIDCGNPPYANTYGYPPYGNTDREDLYKIPEIGKLLKTYLPNEWWNNQGDDFAQSLANSNTDEPNTSSNNALTSPSQFKKKYSDKITSFNPSTDTLEIDTENFGIDSSATFAAGKNKKAVKKKLAKQDFDFLYDQKKGGLYFNENGSDKGFGDGGIIAILKGAPDLYADNLQFI